jgi:hypothetical protein
MIMTQAQNIIAGGFDLDQLDVPMEENLHKVVVVSDIDGNDKCGFYIASKNSAAYQEAARQVRIDGLKRSSKRKTTLDTSTDEGAASVAKLIDANELALVCSVVKDWFGFESKGVAAPFDITTVAKMMVKMPTWREKISAALENESNFLKV